MERASSSFFLWQRLCERNGGRWAGIRWQKIPRPRTRYLDLIDNREPSKIVEQGKASGTVFHLGRLTPSGEQSKLEMYMYAHVYILRKVKIDIYTNTQAQKHKVNS